MSTTSMEHHRWSFPGNGKTLIPRAAFSDKLPGTTCGARLTPLRVHANCHVYYPLWLSHNAQFSWPKRERGLLMYRKLNRNGTKVRADCSEYLSSRNMLDMVTARRWIDGNLNIQFEGMRFSAPHRQGNILEDWDSFSRNENSTLFTELS